MLFRSPAGTGRGPRGALRASCAVFSVPPHPHPPCPSGPPAPAGWAAGRRGRPVSWPRLPLHPASSSEGDSAPRRHLPGVLTLSSSPASRPPTSPPVFHSLTRLLLVSIVHIKKGPFWEQRQCSPSGFGCRSSPAAGFTVGSSGLLVTLEEHSVPWVTVMKVAWIGGQGCYP